jgi:hypothetical protein
MPFNTLVQRSDVSTRIPSNISNEMLTTLSRTSTALTIGKRIPMPAGVTRFPVLSAMPQAYWVNGDTGLKQTSTMAWDDKFITVEELAVIVPVPDNVRDDVDFDIWGELRPAMESAIAQKIDQAVFLGIDKPASFPESLVQGAIAHENTVTRGTAPVAEGGIHADVSDLLALLEDEGYTANAGIYRTGLRSTIRRSAIPANSPDNGITAADWYGANMASNALEGLWPAMGAEAIVGDFSKLVVGVRHDFDYKLMTEGVISDAEGKIVFNLPQQDMTALRVTFRMGYQIANPINYEEPDEAERYPFAALLRPAA